MSANPALVLTLQQELVPAPFPGESFLLKRSGVTLELDGVRTPTGKWSTRGFLFVSNVRMVFTAEKPDASGLVGFDFPLVYIRRDSLNQPIFGCNNLTGEVWPATDGGGPAGSLPPHKFTIYFKEGGIGTFYPLYYTLAERAKQSFAGVSSGGLQQQQQRHAPGVQPGWQDPNPAAYAESLAARAYVDPHDPRLFTSPRLEPMYRNCNLLLKPYAARISAVHDVVQPTDDSQRLAERPRYAANYGQEETYEDMVPGHGPNGPPRS